MLWFVVCCLYTVRAETDFFSRKFGGAPYWRGPLLQFMCACRCLWARAGTLSGGTSRLFPPIHFSIHSLCRIHRRQCPVAPQFWTAPAAAKSTDLAIGDRAGVENLYSGCSGCGYYCPSWKCQIPLFKKLWKKFLVPQKKFLVPLSRQFCENLLAHPRRRLMHQGHQHLKRLGIHRQAKDPFTHFLRGVPMSENGRSSDCYCFLFNDMFLMTKVKKITVKSKVRNNNNLGREWLAGNLKTP